MYVPRSYLPVEWTSPFSRNHLKISKISPKNGNFSPKLLIPLALLIEYTPMLTKKEQIENSQSQKMFFHCRGSSVPVLLEILLISG